MPVRRIWVKKNTTDSDFVKVDAESIGNRKPKCAAVGYCTGGSGTNWSDADNYKYQIPCDGDWDCIFYNNSTANLVKGTCQPINNSSDEDPEGFGNIKGQGCRADYYEFYLNVANTGIYKPAVQVLDNWGWCSGGCTTALYADNGINYGCYNDYSGYDCEQSGGNLKNPWINYNGNVIVK